ncbi:MAG TPA: PEP/pyruvate-binding domain-containing protein [Spirochaetia bacterium]|nr:PEP/pyruvate-binding domain-containing protein [Spirochaetia bacterium]
MPSYVKNLRDMTKEDFQETGGKAANLGELARNGFNVPPAFCVTARSLDHVIDSNNAMPKILEISSTLDYDDYDGMEEKTARIRELISSARIPRDLEAEIRQGIDGLRGPSAGEPFVAVRSSVAVRDSSVSSFPGMMDTFHFLKGEAQIVEYIRKCWASLWTARAAMRRHQMGIDHGKGIIAPLVQKMVNADVAGVMFTANPITGSREEIVIEANWGLGESLVSGESINDYFVLGKGSPPAIKEKRIQKKTIMVTLDKEKGVGRKKYDVPSELSEAATLSDSQLRELAARGGEIENVFQFPQDIEWAYEKATLYLLQSRKIKGLKA